MTFYGILSCLRYALNGGEKEKTGVFSAASIPTHIMKIRRRSQKPTLEGYRRFYLFTHVCLSLWHGSGLLCGFARLYSVTGLRFFLFDICTACLCCSESLCYLGPSFAEIRYQILVPFAKLVLCAFRCTKLPWAEPFKANSIEPFLYAALTVQRQWFAPSMLAFGILFVHAAHGSHHSGLILNKNIGIRLPT